MNTHMLSLRYQVVVRHLLKPERLIGDTAYGTAPMLAWMVEEKVIEPHVPLWTKPNARTTAFEQRFPLE